MITKAHPKHWKVIAQGLGLLRLPEADRQILDHLLWHGRFLEWSIQESITPAQYFVNVLGHGEEKTYRRALVRLQRRQFLYVRKDPLFRWQLMLLEPLVDACRAEIERMNARRRIGAWGMHMLGKEFPNATQDEIIAMVTERVAIGTGLPKREPARTRRAVDVLQWERRAAQRDTETGPPQAHG